VSTASSELTAKRVELFKMALPTLARVAVLLDPASPSSAPSLAETATAAQVLGLRLQSFPVRTSADIDAAFETMAGALVQGVIVLPGGGTISIEGPRIAQLALVQRLPIIGSNRTTAEAGGLLSYGANNAAMVKRAAVHVDRILKGSKPGDLPIELPSVFDFVVNLKTAQALGVTIPQAMLQQATEVIQ
jgi:putative ABC transport system substrate-binding protein